MIKLNEKEKLLHQKFSEYGQNAKEWMRKCVLLLPEIEREKIWQKKGFSCIYEYAAKLAGMSHGVVDDALRILNKIKDKPDLMRVVEKKGINAVRPVATIATKENQEFWAQKANVMSKNTLEVYVREFNCLSRTGTREDMKSNMSTVTMELSPEILSKLEKLKGEGSWNVLMKQILNEREEWLEKEKPMKIKTKSKHVPVKIAKYVKKKTNNTCAFPGCCKKAVEDHHADRHSLSKMHDPEKIVPLCRAHHRLAHLGLIENEDLPPEFWEVRRSENLYDLKALVDRRVQEKIWKGG